MKRFLLILYLLIWATPSWAVNVIGSGAAAPVGGAFVNLTSFAGSNGDSITVDTGWVLHTSYSGTAKIYNSEAYQDTTTNSLFYRTETPTSANQTVTIGYKNVTNSNNTVNLAARVDAAANTFLLGQLVSGATTFQFKLYKFEAGTATQIGTTQSISSPASGTRNLVFSVSGSSPNIAMSLVYDGTTILSETGISATGLDSAGKVGIRFGTSATASTTTAGAHIVSFTGE